MNKNVVVNAFISQNNIKIIATAKLNNHIINIHEESISKNNNFENRNEIKNSIKNNHLKSNWNGENIIQKDYYY